MCDKSFDFNDSNIYNLLYLYLYCSINFIINNSRWFLLGDTQ